MTTPETAGRVSADTFVHVAGVRVRLRITDRGTCWRCDECGVGSTVRCTHAAHAAAAFARDYLGITATAAPAPTAAPPPSGAGTTEKESSA